ncbi:hypothetical protein ACFSL4_30130 [Streptomyces caeni]|uniref:Thiocillin family RiPP n=1 Tax=Streptomyces caeni TaxID=2307231 RepID=A0ABW4J2B3_9ACTN
MEEFSLPEDITALNDDELDALLDGAVKAFDGSGSCGSAPRACAARPSSSK